MNISTALGLLFLSHTAYGMDGEDPKKSIVPAQKKHQAQDQEEWSLTLLPPEIINHIVSYCDGHRNTVSLISKFFLNPARKGHIHFFPEGKNNAPQQSMPLEVFQAFQPTKLSLSKNRSISGKMFSCATNLTGLTSLDLSDNYMIENPALEVLTALKKLTLTRNHIITDEYLTNLRCLTSLDLSNNGAINGSALEILTALETLSLEGNTRIPNDSLTHLTNLMRLTLTNNSLINNETVSRFTRLTALNINNINNIDVAILLNLTGLRELSLANKTLIPEDILPNLTTLQKLDLSGVDNIYNALTSLTQLNTLKVRGHAAIYLRNLQHLTALTCLDVSYNNGVIIQALKLLPSLRYLTLSTNSALHNEELLTLPALLEVTLRDISSKPARPEWYKAANKYKIRLRGIPTGQTKALPL